MNSAGWSNISSIFQHGLQDGYLSLNPHVKGGLFPLILKILKITMLIGVLFAWIVQFSFCSFVDSVDLFTHTTTSSLLAEAINVEVNMVDE